MKGEGMSNTVDGAIALYTAKLWTIADDHEATNTAIAVQLAETESAAREKLDAAQREHDEVVARAKAEASEVIGAAHQAKVEAEQAATVEFDTMVRRSIQAPAGARVVGAGNQLSLDLGDGRQPIAHATPIGGGAWLVEGSGETVMCGSPVQARAELWKRCRPAPTLAEVVNDG